MAAMTQNPHYNRDPHGIAATPREFQKTVNALNKIMWSPRVPKSVQVQAWKLHEAVYQTGRIGESGDWIRDTWARYLVKANLVLAALLALLPLVLMQDVWGLILGALVFWGVSVASRHVRAAAVRGSRRIPS